MRRELGMLVALVVMCVALFISNPDFLGSDNVSNTLRHIGMLGILTVGVSFVIITGGIDLSIGSIIGLTGVLIAKISSPAMECMHKPLWVGITVALIVALAIGWIQGLLITRLDLQPFIVTLGFMLLLRGISQTITEGGTLSFGNSHIKILNTGGWLTVAGKPLLPYPVLIFIVVAVAATYLLHFTVLGRYIYAIGGNRDAAEYSGIPVKRVETFTYVVSAGMAGLSGVCYAAYIGQMTHQVGIAYELYAIAAAVIGGVSLRGGEGTVIGMVIGAAMIRVIDNGINLFQFNYTDAQGQGQIFRLGSNWTFVVYGAVILAAVMLDQLAHIFKERRRIRQAGEIARQSAGAAQAVS